MHVETGRRHWGRGNRIEGVTGRGEDLNLVPSNGMHPVSIRQVSLESNAFNCFTSALSQMSWHLCIIMVRSLAAFDTYPAGVDTCLGDHSQDRRGLPEAAPEGPSSSTQAAG